MVNDEFKQRIAAHSLAQNCEAFLRLHCNIWKAVAKRFRPRKVMQLVFAKHRRIKKPNEAKRLPASEFLCRHCRAYKISTAQVEILADMELPRMDLSVYDY